MPTGPNALPAALPQPPPQPPLIQPAAVTTAHKPWRVHFSQVEEDPFPPPPTTHAQAAVDAARRPWRVRVSSVPEGEDDAGGSAAAAAAAAAGGEADGEGAAGAMQGVEEAEEDDEGMLGAAGPGAAALPPAKPWLVRHVDLSVDDDEALRPRAAPAPPLPVRVHMPSEPHGTSLDTTSTSTSTHTHTTSASGTAAAVAVGRTAAAKHADATVAAERGAGGRAGGGRHPSAVALLEALQSSQESGAASTAPGSGSGSDSGLAARGAAPAAAVGPAGAAPGHSHLHVNLHHQQRNDGLSLGHGRSGGGFSGAGMHARDGDRDGDGGFEPSFTQLAADLQALRADLDTGRPAPAPAQPAPMLAGQLVPCKPGSPPRPKPSLIGRGSRNNWGPAPVPDLAFEERGEEQFWEAGPGLSQLVAELRAARTGLGGGPDPGAARLAATRADSAGAQQMGAALRYPAPVLQEQEADGHGGAQGMQLCQEDYGPGPGLSQLVAELRDARNGLGAGGTGGGAGGGGGGKGEAGSDHEGHADAPAPEPLMAAGAAQAGLRLWSPPRDVVWGRSSQQRARGVSHRSPPAHQHHIPQQHIDDVSELGMEDGEGAASEVVPGPLTQLIQGMQEARQGLQAGRGGGWRPDEQRQEQGRSPPRPPEDRWGRHGERHEQWGTTGAGAAAAGAAAAAAAAAAGALSSAAAISRYDQHPHPQPGLQPQEPLRTAEWALPPLSDTEEDYAMAGGPARDPLRQRGAAAAGAGPWGQHPAASTAPPVEQPAVGPSASLSLSQLVDSMRQARQGLAGGAAQRDVPPLSSLPHPAGEDSGAAAAPSPAHLSPTRRREAGSPSRRQSNAESDGAEANYAGEAAEGALAAPQPADAAADDISFSQLVRLMQRQKISRQQAAGTSDPQLQLGEQSQADEAEIGQHAAAAEEQGDIGPVLGVGLDSEPAGAADEGADSDATQEPPSPRLRLDLGEPAPDGSVGASQGDTLRVKPEVASPAGVKPGPVGPCALPAAERSPPPQLHEPAADAMDWEARQRAVPQPASPLYALGYAAGAAAGLSGRNAPRHTQQQYTPQQEQQDLQSVEAGAAAACKTGLGSSPLVGGRTASAVVAAAALPLPLSQQLDFEADTTSSYGAGPQLNSQGCGRVAQGLQVVVPGVAVAVAAAGHSPVLRPVSLWERLGPQSPPQSPSVGLRSHDTASNKPTGVAGGTHGVAEDGVSFGGFSVPAASQGAATTAGLRSPLPPARGTLPRWGGGIDGDGTMADMDTGTPAPALARTPAPAASGQELSFGFGVGLGELARADADTPASVRGGGGRTPARAAAGAAAAAAAAALAAASGPLGRYSGKAAARKMDSRTPSVLSTQGKHKRREVRATPAAMRGLQPLPPAPALWPDASQSQAGIQDSGAGLAAVASLQQRAAARQGSQAQQQPVARALAPNSHGSAAADSQPRSQQDAQPAPHSQGLASLLTGCSQQPGSLQAGGGSLPQLGLEEVMERRANMPWAQSTAGGARGSTVTAVPTAAAVGTALGAPVGWQGVCCPSPMPITPGPWALGQDSDAEDDVDEAAMLAAGRAAAAARAAGAAGSGGNGAGAVGLGIALVPATTAGAVQLGGGSSCSAATAAGGACKERGVAEAAGAAGALGTPRELAAARCGGAPSGSTSGSGSEDDDDDDDDNISPPVFNMSRGRSRLRYEQAAARQQAAAAGAVPAAAAATADAAPSPAAASPAAAVARAALLALPPGSESQSQSQLDGPAGPAVHAAAAQQSACHQPHVADVSDAVRALGSLELREAVDDWRHAAAAAAGATAATEAGGEDAATSTPRGADAAADGLAAAPGLATAATGASQQEQQQLLLHGSLPQALAGEGAGKGGLLAGAAVIIDRCLSEDQASRCMAAVAGLGGHVSAASHLGCGAAAVVCAPDRAPHWMAWGAHLLSPRSLTRLAGQQDAADASEPADAAAVAAAAASSLICLSRGVASALTEACCQRSDGSSSSSSTSTSSSDPETDIGACGTRTRGCPNGMPPKGLAARGAAAATGAEDEAPGEGGSRGGAWASRAARRQLVIDIKAAEDSTAAVKLLGLRGAAAAAHLRKPPAAPPSLLDHVVWNVTQPPEAAQSVAPPADCGGYDEVAGEAAEEAWGYGGSQGESQADGAAYEAMGYLASASQLQEPRAVEQQELDAVVYAGRRLTLLLPQDRHGVLGHSSLTVAAAPPPPLSCAPLQPGAAPAGRGGGGGITLRALLGAVQRHYAAPLSDGDMVEAMATHPDLRRALQVAWQKAQPLPRSALLGPAVVLVGLRRCGQSGVLPVYELQLAQ
ncbi:hypothetical protein HYH02_006196 [Chlamydomonas schloesseri]|uniref:Uncharacterized protein n=1 Tax=Chlamydomonas schloesseri TaxID=2026947 RepID=A0A835WL86_9CHLO|nr:hypothetical protein HYH02_006196 [Chlamydomonas schloesseri]|eukprot:KAG2448845.1 hypothetical protein HYH02_006196 [Chlamydomonas schloesseri]